MFCKIYEERKNHKPTTLSENKKGVFNANYINVLRNNNTNVLT